MNLPGAPAQIPVVRVTTLARCNFRAERREDGGMDLHFDLLLSAQAAERYTLPFDAQGWENFRKTLEAAGSGIEIAPVLPFERLQ